MPVEAANTTDLAHDLGPPGECRVRFSAGARFMSGDVQKMMDAEVEATERLKSLLESTPDAGRTNPREPIGRRSAARDL